MMAAVMTALLLLAQPGCGDDSGGSGSDSDSDGDAATGSSALTPSLGSNCELNADCDSSLCLSGAATHQADTEVAFCSQSCSVDDDCEFSARSGGMICATGPSGAQICAPPCHEPNGFACVGGDTVACSQVGDGYCAQCGCPTGERCSLEQKCEPLASEGDGCEGDADCLSDNCGSGGQCRVAIGDSCDASNCDMCLSQGSWSFCSRECEIQQECDGVAYCLKPAGTDGFSCKPICNAENDTDACPVDCKRAENRDTDWYCECEDCDASFPGDEVAARATQRGVGRFLATNVMSSCVFC